ncbi:MAG: hypothetical protein PT955_08510 [Bacteroidales bacterium]|nr:hypothetical protein [Bacteroidales bacterium]
MRGYWLEVREPLRFITHRLPGRTKARPYMQTVQALVFTHPGDGITPTRQTLQIERRGIIIVSKIR